MSDFFVTICILSLKNNLKNCARHFSVKFLSNEKIFGNKNAIKRKSLANLDESELTEINRLLTEQTPQINRLTDRPKFSRIPNPISPIFL